MTAADPLHTLDDVAARLAITKRTLMRWLARGDGPPCVRIRSVVRVRESSLVTWLAEHEDRAAA